MTNDGYMIAITALLPMMAVLLVLQVNPYQALVIRGILGAIAALIYAMYGAADVALTEALVGTMLSITLYAGAVRSAMIVRIGVIEQNESEETAPEKRVFEKVAVEPRATREEAVERAAAEKEATEKEAIRKESLEEDCEEKEVCLSQQAFSTLENVFNRHHVRIELLPYSDNSSLVAALKAKEIHAIYGPSGLLQTRVERLYNILQSGLPPDMNVSYLDLSSTRV